MTKETLQKIVENDILSLYNSGRSIKSLHKEYNISERSISQYLSQNGVPIRKDKDLLTYDVFEAQKLYENGLTLNEISQKLNVTRQSISKQLKKIGVKVLRANIMKDLNENVFDSIDTEEKAYWLGFLFADGNISNKNNYIRINLSKKDKKHLEKLKMFLNYERDVLDYETKQGYNISRMSVSNKHLWNKLNELGCTPNKSLTLKFPKCVFNEKQELIRHFLRGYFDGDGCLSFRDKEHKRPKIYLLGTVDFLREMETLIPFKPLKNIYLKHKNRNNFITGVWSKEGKTAYEFAKYLYENSTIFLDRKYDVYLEYCRLYEKS